MGISLNCFTAALGTFTPSPADITHPEVLARKIADWTNPQRLIAKTSASRFHLEPAEHTVFNDWWELAEPARELLDRGHNRDGTGEIDAEIRRAFVRLAAIVNDKARYDEPGYRHVRRVSGSDRFVIFSDHHMAFPGSRQDFFRTSGNRELYAEILTEYAECGFTLVENGDVEELIIHEPLLPPPQSQLSLLKKVRDTRNLDDSGWEALDDLRTDWRLNQLSQVILNHRELYDQINTQFVEKGRYYRTAGNHDQDNQDSRFLEALRRVYPKLEQVYDFLIIEPSGANDSNFVVCHGHHFDTSGTPNAPISLKSASPALSLRKYSQAILCLNVVSQNAGFDNSSARLAAIPSAPPSPARPAIPPMSVPSQVARPLSTTSLNEKRSLSKSSVTSVLKKASSPLAHRCTPSRPSHRQTRSAPS